MDMLIDSPSRNLEPDDEAQLPRRTVTRIRTLGVPLDTAETVNGYLDALPRKDAIGRVAFIATFLNPASLLEAKRHPTLATTLDSFDLVMPDGIGACMAVRRLHGLTVARVSFDSTSLAPIVFEAAQRDGNTIALVGGRPGVARRAAEVLRHTFPDLAIVGTFDGYTPPGSTIAALRKLSPDIVICGMGVRRQEEFLLALRASGWTGSGFTCGGYLDQLADGFRYYPAWVDAINLRWAYRLYREPGRLWRRYCMDYPVFLALVIRAMAAKFRRQLKGPATEPNANRPLVN
ncbi:WecB/TagA/CpsF family glycosyltransferase [Rhodovastum atsumiense]|uniref:WecB/TagA/CpsF family glycosyltransferase n=1 Tax=Rhodovastum atsumiense TaxID=504468 RepID=A0A5M6J325_9PROT|nr:WecB/TagA/CpsF family glycosyltransferase [Rhodovastum atsumiense]KAA5614639.1 WecB/TagA/CpsF family glycosyltransferase [Rhodovastum atsumiense]CAH2599846.1 WecB/TagA/CpsF family glycosyltransferase [Rhodovastum atsumiense]